MYVHPQPSISTPPASTPQPALRAIQGGMQVIPQMKPARVRPASQSAQVIMRMSHDQRAVLHQLAEEAGMSTTAYVLSLAIGDATDRCAFSERDILAGMVTTSSEAPDPSSGREPQAKADRAVPAAAG